MSFHSCHAFLCHVAIVASPVIDERYERLVATVAVLQCFFQAFEHAVGELLAAEHVQTRVCLFDAQTGLLVISFADRVESRCVYEDDSCSGYTVFPSFLRSGNTMAGFCFIASAQCVNQGGFSILKITSYGHSYHTLLIISGERA